MTREFHPAAREEFVATADFYEAERRGLGRQFRDAVHRTLDNVEAFTEIGRPSRRNARCVALDGFPYDLVYRVRGELLEILALAHHRRRPGYWRDRIAP